jgi:hypothetical protein
MGAGSWVSHRSRHRSPQIVNAAGIGRITVWEHIGRAVAGGSLGRCPREWKPLSWSGAWSKRRGKRRRTINPISAQLAARQGRDAFPAVAGVLVKVHCAWRRDALTQSGSWPTPRSCNALTLWMSCQLRSSWNYHPLGSPWPRIFRLADGGLSPKIRANCLI